MAGIWRLAIRLLPLVAATFADENSTVAENCSGESDLYDGEVHVYLTLSALAETFMDGRVQQRLIELNWINGDSIPVDIDAESDDWIGLYDQDPLAEPTQPLVQINASEHDGYFKTNIQYDPSNQSNLSMTTEVVEDLCLGYWIGYIHNGTIIAVNSLKLQPSWMWQNRELLGPVALRNLVLPGTHNAGSYRSYNGHHSDTVFTRYLVCQDEDIKTQLNYGIRYLDIRVGYYPDQPEGFQFWLNHNYARLNPLSNLIDDVAAFLQTSREVLVVDFHRFPKGFDSHPEAHGLLVEYLHRHWGDWMASINVGADVTVDKLWASNKTLIVAYADYDTRVAHPFLWSNIPQEWGDERSVEGLYSFLQLANERHDDDPYFWAAMAELTPSAIDVIFRPQGGLRRLAQLVNAKVTHWYQYHEFWSKANIVAVDFFHGTDIVDIAIRASLKRAACSNLT